MLMSRFDTSVLDTADEDLIRLKQVPLLVDGLAREFTDYRVNFIFDPDGFS